jgi:hypothetical protein
MLIAELRRKLSDLNEVDASAPDAIERVKKLLRETKEDLLTADVFGILKYLPRFPYLEAVIDMIAERNQSAEEFRRHRSALIERLRDVQFRFWPEHPTPNGISAGRTEPDLEITSPVSFILVEAKLHSGFGKLQVERELAVALEQCEEREAFLLLVTRSSDQP